MEDEEVQKFTDEAAGYYVGLWNILIQAGAPVSVIVNQAINNMLTVLDRYMDSKEKIELLEIMTSKAKEEAAAEVNQSH